MSARHTPCISFPGESCVVLLLSQVKHCVVTTGVRKQPTMQCCRTGQAEVARKQLYTQQRRSSHSAGARGSPPRCPTRASIYETVRACSAEHASIGEAGRVCSAEEAGGPPAAALPCFLVIVQLTGVQTHALAAGYRPPCRLAGCAKRFLSEFPERDLERDPEWDQRMHLGGSLPAVQSSI